MLNIYSRSDHSFICLFIGETDRTNLALHFLLTSKSSAVNGCHQRVHNESKFHTKIHQHLCLECFEQLWFVNGALLVHISLLISLLITGESNNMDRELVFILMMNLFITNTQLLTSQDINLWTGVLWITCG